MRVDGEFNPLAVIFFGFNMGDFAVDGAVAVDQALHLFGFVGGDVADFVLVPEDDDGVFVVGVVRLALQGERIAKVHDVGEFVGAVVFEAAHGEMGNDGFAQKAMNEVGDGIHGCSLGWSFGKYS